MFQPIVHIQRKSDMRGYSYCATSMTRAVRCAAAAVSSRKASTSKRPEMGCPFRPAAVSPSCKVTCEPDKSFATIRCNKYSSQCRVRR